MSFPPIVALCGDVRAIALDGAHAHSDTVGRVVETLRSAELLLRIRRLSGTVGVATAASAKATVGPIPEAAALGYLLQRAPPSARAALEAKAAKLSPSEVSFAGGRWKWGSVFERLFVDDVATLLGVEHGEATRLWRASPAQTVRGPQLLHPSHLEAVRDYYFSERCGVLELVSALYHLAHALGKGGGLLGDCVRDFLDKLEKGEEGEGGKGGDGGEQGRLWGGGIHARLLHLFNALGTIRAPSSACPSPTPPQLPNASGSGSAKGGGGGGKRAFGGKSLFGTSAGKTASSAGSGGSGESGGSVEDWVVRIGWEEGKYGETRWPRHTFAPHEREATSQGFEFLARHNLVWGRQVGEERVLCLEALAWGLFQRYEAPPGLIARLLVSLRPLIEQRIPWVEGISVDEEVIARGSRWGVIALCLSLNLAKALTPLTLPQSQWAQVPGASGLLVPLPPSLLLSDSAVPSSSMSSKLATVDELGEVEVHLRLWLAYTGGESLEGYDQSSDDPIAARSLRTPSTTSLPSTTGKQQTSSSSLLPSTPTSATLTLADSVESWKGADAVRLDAALGVDYVALIEGFGDVITPSRSPSTPSLPSSPSALLFALLDDVVTVVEAEPLGPSAALAPLAAVYSLTATLKGALRHQRNAARRKIHANLVTLLRERIEEKTNPSSSAGGGEAEGEEDESVYSDEDDDDEGDAKGEEESGEVEDDGYVAADLTELRKAELGDRAVLRWVGRKDVKKEEMVRWKWRKKGGDVSMEKKALDVLEKFAVDDGARDEAKNDVVSLPVLMAACAELRSLCFRFSSASSPASPPIDLHEADGDIPPVEQHEWVSERAVEGLEAYSLPSPLLSHGPNFFLSPILHHLFGHQTLTSNLFPSTSTSPFSAISIVGAGWPTPASPPTPAPTSSIAPQPATPLLSVDAQAGGGNTGGIVAGTLAWDVVCAIGASLFGGEVEDGESHEGGRDDGGRRGGRKDDRGMLDESTFSTLHLPTGFSPYVGEHHSLPVEEPSAGSRRLPVPSSSLAVVRSGVVEVAAAATAAGGPALAYSATWQARLARIDALTAAAERYGRNIAREAAEELSAEPGSRAARRLARRAIQLSQSAEAVAQRLRAGRTLDAGCVLGPWPFLRSSAQEFPYHPNPTFRLLRLLAGAGSSYQIPDQTPPTTATLSLATNLPRFTQVLPSAHPPTLGALMLRPGPTGSSRPGRVEQGSFLQLTRSLYFPSDGVTLPEGTVGVVLKGSLQLSSTTPTTSHTPLPSTVSTMALHARHSATPTILVSWEVETNLWKTALRHLVIASASITSSSHSSSSSSSSSIPSTSTPTYWSLPAAVEASTEILRLLGRMWARDQDSIFATLSELSSSRYSVDGIAGDLALCLAGMVVGLSPHTQPPPPTPSAAATAASAADSSTIPPTSTLLFTSPDVADLSVARAIERSRSAHAAPLVAPESAEHLAFRSKASTCLAGAARCLALLGAVAPAALATAVAAGAASPLSPWLLDALEELGMEEAAGSIAPAPGAIVSSLTSLLSSETSDSLSTSSTSPALPAMAAVESSRLLRTVTRSLLRRSLVLDAGAAFARLDTDDSGSVDVTEFLAALQAMGLDLSPDARSALLAKLDRDGNGSIEYGELVFFCQAELQAAARAPTHPLAAESNGIDDESGLADAVADELREFVHVVTGRSPARLRAERAALNQCADAAADAFPRLLAGAPLPAHARYVMTTQLLGLLLDILRHRGGNIEAAADRRENPSSTSRPLRDDVLRGFLSDTSLRRALVSAATLVPISAMRPRRVPLPKGDEDARAGAADRKRSATNARRWSKLRKKEGDEGVGGKKKEEEKKESDDVVGDDELEDLEMETTWGLLPVLDWNAGVLGRATSSAARRSLEDLTLIALRVLSEILAGAPFAPLPTGGSGVRLEDGFGASMLRQAGADAWDVAGGIAGEESQGLSWAAQEKVQLLEETTPLDMTMHEWESGGGVEGVGLKRGRGTWSAEAPPSRVTLPLALAALADYRSTTPAGSAAADADVNGLRDRRCYMGVSDGTAATYHPHSIAGQSIASAATRVLSLALSVQTRLWAASRGQGGPLIAALRRQCSLTLQLTGVSNRLALRAALLGLPPVDRSSIVAVPTGIPPACVGPLLLETMHLARTAVVAGAPGTGMVGLLLQPTPTISALSPSSPPLVSASSPKATSSSTIPPFEEPNESAAVGGGPRIGTTSAEKAVAHLPLPSVLREALWSVSRSEELIWLDPTRLCSALALLDTLWTESAKRRNSRGQSALRLLDLTHAARSSPGFWRHMLGIVCGGGGGGNGGGGGGSSGSGEGVELEGARGSGSSGGEEGKSDDGEVVRSMLRSGSSFDALPPLVPVIPAHVRAQSLGDPRDPGFSPAAVAQWSHRLAARSLAARIVAAELLAVARGQVGVSPVSGSSAGGGEAAPSVRDDPLDTPTLSRVQPGELPSTRRPLSRLPHMFRAICSRVTATAVAAAAKDATTEETHRVAFAAHRARIAAAMSAERSRADSSASAASSTKTPPAPTSPTLPPPPTAASPITNEWSSGLARIASDWTRSSVPASWSVLLPSLVSESGAMLEAFCRPVASAASSRNATRLAELRGGAPGISGMGPPLVTPEGAAANPKHFGVAIQGPEAGLVASRRDSVDTCVAWVSSEDPSFARYGASFRADVEDLASSLGITRLWHESRRERSCIHALDQLEGAAAAAVASKLTVGSASRILIACRRARGQLIDLHLKRKPLSGPRERALTAVWAAAAWSAAQSIQDAQLGASSAARALLTAIAQFQGPPRPTRVLTPTRVEEEGLQRFPLFEASTAMPFALAEAALQRLRNPPQPQASSWRIRREAAVTAAVLLDVQWGGAAASALSGQNGIASLLHDETPGDAAVLGRMQASTDGASKAAAPGASTIGSASTIGAAAGPSVATAAAAGAIPSERMLRMVQALCDAITAHLPAKRPYTSHRVPLEGPLAEVLTTLLLTTAAIVTRLSRRNQNEVIDQTISSSSSSSSSSSTRVPSTPPRKGSSKTSAAGASTAAFASPLSPEERSRRISDGMSGKGGPPRRATLRVHLQQTAARLIPAMGECLALVAERFSLPLVSSTASAAARNVARRWGAEDDAIDAAASLPTASSTSKSSSTSSSSSSRSGRVGEPASSFSTTSSSSSFHFSSTSRTSSSSSSSSTTASSDPPLSTPSRVLPEQVKGLLGPLSGLGMAWEGQLLNAVLWALAVVTPLAGPKLALGTLFSKGVFHSAVNIARAASEDAAALLAAYAAWGSANRDSLLRFAAHHSASTSLPSSSATPGLSAAAAREADLLAMASWSQEAVDSVDPMLVGRMRSLAAARQFISGPDAPDVRSRAFLAGALGRLHASVAVLRAAARHRASSGLLVSIGVLDHLLLRNPLWEHMEWVQRRREAAGAVGAVTTDARAVRWGKRVLPAVFHPRWAGVGWGLGPAVFRGYDAAGSDSVAHLAWCETLTLATLLTRRLERVAAAARASKQTLAFVQEQAKAKKEKAAGLSEGSRREGRGSGDGDGVERRRSSVERGLRAASAPHDDGALGHSGTDSLFAAEDADGEGGAVRERLRSLTAPTMTLRQASLEVQAFEAPLRRNPEILQQLAQGVGGFRTESSSTTASVTALASNGGDFEEKEEERRRLEAERAADEADLSGIGDVARDTVRRLRLSVARSAESRRSYSRQGATTTPIPKFPTLPPPASESSAKYGDSSGLGRDLKIEDLLEHDADGGGGRRVGGRVVGRGGGGDGGRGFGGSVVRARAPTSAEALFLAAGSALVDCVLKFRATVQSALLCRAQTLRGLREMDAVARVAGATLASELAPIWARKARVDHSAPSFDTWERAREAREAALASGLGPTAANEAAARITRASSTPPDMRAFLCAVLEDSARALVLQLGSGGRDVTVLSGAAASIGQAEVAVEVAVSQRRELRFAHGIAVLPVSTGEVAAATEAVVRERLAWESVLQSASKAMRDGYTRNDQVAAVRSSAAHALASQAARKRPSKLRDKMIKVARAVGKKRESEAAEREAAMGVDASLEKEASGAGSGMGAGRQPSGTSFGTGGIATAGHATASSRGSGPTVGRVFDALIDLHLSSALRSVMEACTTATLWNVSAARMRALRAAMEHAGVDTRVPSATIDPSVRAARVLASAHGRGAIALSDVAERVLVESGGSLLFTERSPVKSSSVTLGPSHHRAPSPTYNPSRVSHPSTHSLPHRPSASPHHFPSPPGHLSPHSMLSRARAPTLTSLGDQTLDGTGPNGEHLGVHSGSILALGAAAFERKWEVENLRKAQKAAIARVYAPLFADAEPGVCLFGRATSTPDSIVTGGSWLQEAPGLGHLLASLRYAVTGGVSAGLATSVLAKRGIGDDIGEDAGSTLMPGSPRITPSRRRSSSIGSLSPVLAPDTVASNILPRSGGMDDEADDLNLLASQGLSGRGVHVSSPTSVGSPRAGAVTVLHTHTSNTPRFQESSHARVLRQLARASLLLVARVVDKAARSSSLSAEDVLYVASALSDVVGDGGIEFARWKASGESEATGGGGEPHAPTSVAHTTTKTTTFSTLGGATSTFPEASSLAGTAMTRAQDAAARRNRTELLGAVIGDAQWTHRLVVFLHLLLHAAVEPPAIKRRAHLRRDLRAKYGDRDLPFGFVG